MVATVLLSVVPMRIASGATRVVAQTTRPATGVTLDRRVRALWRAIRRDDLALAAPLFFPRGAYVHLKAIYDPSADFTDRLWALFRLDFAAYHAATAGATFEGVRVDPADVAWIRPGTCENSIGYWHLPGVRMVYRQRGVERSVGVFSFISWRGVWYVVHLGPNPRPVNVGTLDAPAIGTGVPGGGGC